MIRADAAEDVQGPRAEAAKIQCHSREPGARNGGTQAVTLALRPADALTPAGGGVAFSKAGQRLVGDGA